MIIIEELEKEIVLKLKPLNPNKIILFGSFAKGTSREDSDVDLYIVTEDNFIPKTWKEKSEIYIKYSQQLRELRKKISIDLIVHTKKMHEKFITYNTPFAKEILQGKILWMK